MEEKQERQPHRSHWLLLLFLGVLLLVGVPVGAYHWL